MGSYICPFTNNYNSVADSSIPFNAGLIRINSLIQPWAYIFLILSAVIVVSSEPTPIVRVPSDAKSPVPPGRMGSVSILIYSYTGLSSLGTFVCL